MKEHDSVSIRLWREISSAIAAEVYLIGVAAIYTCIYKNLRYGIKAKKFDVRRID